MDVPGIVEDALDGEEVAADVDLGGDDALFVTPTRTLIYRSEGLLSDESVESYGHEAESLSISEGRRKTRITLEHPIDGVEEFTLPSDAADGALPSILAGVLRANDVLVEDESLVDTYLFSELTLVVTDDRLVKHVGETVWDLEFEEYPFADVTGVYAEKGSVATQLIVEVDGRAERIKTPSDRARAVRETLEDALRRHHGLRSDEDLNEALAPAEPQEPEPEPESDATSTSPSGGMDFGDGVEPLSAGDTTQDGRDPDPRDYGADAADAEAAAPDRETDGERASRNATEEPATEGTASREPSARDSAGEETGGATGGENAGDQPSRSQAGDVPSGEAAAGSTETDAAPTGSDAGRTADAGSEAASPTDAPAGAATAPNAEGTPDDVEDAVVDPDVDSTAELAEEVAELRVAVQKQNKLLTRQHKTIEKLVEELRRGR